MSIKIYNAYRLPLSRLNEATELIHNQMRTNAQSHFDGLAEALMKDVPTLNPFDASWKICNLAKSASESPYRSGAALDCGFVFWINQTVSLVYLQFWGMEFTYPENLPDWIEDFHYQNSTDKPDDISDEDWQKRLDEWTHVRMNRESVGRFCHTVIDKDNLWDLAHEFMLRYPPEAFTENKVAEVKECEF